MFTQLNSCRPGFTALLPPTPVGNSKKAALLPPEAEAAYMAFSTAVFGLAKIILPAAVCSTLVTNTPTVSPM